jgi:general secretion pathway protein D
MLAATVGAGLFTVTATSWAGWPSSAYQSLRAAAATGQAASKPASSPDARQQVADLLGRAREEMKAGHYETADSLISRAERLNVPFGFLPRGDTPKKARRDLEKARGAAGPKRPSQLFAPPEQEGDASRQTGNDSAATPANRPGAPADPFAARPAPFEPRMDRPSEADALDGRNGDAPPNERDPDASVPRQGFPTESPFGRELPDEPPSDDDARAGVENLIQSAGPAATPGDPNRAQSDRLLLASRRALAVGDVRRAGTMLNEAKALRLKYEFNEDSPEKVEGLLERWSDLNRQGVNRQTEAFRRGQSDYLLEQAEGLIAWHEFDEAERLVGDAKRLNVPYGPLDAKPDTLLERIAAARQGPQAGIERLPAIAGGDANPAESLAGAEQPFDPDLARKADALRLVAQARAAIKAGEYDRAQALAERAENLRVPDAAFKPRDDRPWLVLNDLQRLRQSGVAAAHHEAQIGADDGQAPPAQQAVYDQNNDPTRNMPAGAQTGVEDSGMLLYQRGEEALRAHDSASALRWFRQANQHRDELDQATLQRLQDRLQLLAQPHAEHAPGEDGSLLHDTVAAQQLKGRQMMTELTRKEQAADRLKTDDPKQALATLQECRALVEKAELDERTRGIFLRRVDRKLKELEHYVAENRGRIELNDKNDLVRKQIARERQTKVEVHEKLAELVEKFNTYMHEQRWSEAEVVYKQAAEIAPDELVVMQLKNMLKLQQRTKNNNLLRERKEEGVFAALEAVEESVIPQDDRKPYQFGPVKDWEKLTKRRKELLSETSNRRSERDIEIENRLRLPVSVNFREAPLTEVISNLGKVAGINVFIDSRGLAEEAVDPMTPVTIDLARQISLKSALNLVLGPLHLSYVIKDEVLKITSEQLRDGEVIVKTYNVADLVTPIPNFVPNANSGLAGALHNAQANMPMNWGGLNGDGPAVSVNSDAGGNAVLDPRMLAQMSSATGGSMSASSGGPGPGGLTGGVQADFESLIELITSTVFPTTWDDVGGPGSITQFQGNLSLVISQTQEVHEEVADLLEQLRRLQDLQVTVEVRFITLNDNYFERIGVNFDFEIPTNTNKPFQIFGNTIGDPTRSINTGATVAFPPPSPGNQDVTPINLRKQNGVTVGLSPGQTGGVLYSSDLDIPFTQGSFGLATPQFGDYQPGAGATLGFAILSNIEAYLLVEGSQGDRRSNVLQAPKVTLFNGQQALVADQTATPFVMSVIPVVGAFAAAQQPVIVVLNEGTALNVQAVVSSDRRFVRLTLIPFFSNISQVNTFTFTGSSSTTTNSDSEGPSDNSTKRQTSSTTAAQGTTVQLPSFSFFTVSTTVSVPDGGTVLLGGVKRLSEGRNEFGVPVLSKIPYVNRLFRNVGIGRETQSLMMMVTPRIIIQEEEEALLGIPATP